MNALVAAVNTVHAVRRGAGRDTAIDKRPVPRPVWFGELGAEGDRQCDTRHHGGPDKAVYAYASEDAAWWAEALGREIPPGYFGENITTTGLDVTGARIGERWRIGAPGVGVLVEVRMPRTPCENLSAWIGEAGFHQRFAATGRVGAYLKVIEPGTVSAGDRIEVDHRPEHDLTIGRYLDRPGPELMAQVLDSDVDLAEVVRRRVRRIAARAAAR